MEEYKRFTLPSLKEFQQMNALEVFNVLLEHDRVVDYNERLYRQRISTYENITNAAREVLGAGHVALTTLARFTPTSPPKTIRLSTLLLRIREAWSSRIPKESERSRILKELKAAGLSDNTNRSTAELRDRLERHYINQLKEAIMAGKEFHQLYDKTACHPRCHGWDGKSDWCSCGRTKLRWMLGPRHSINTPQVMAARIDVRDTVRKEEPEE